MVNIKIKDSYVASNPVIASAPNAFILNIGDDNFAIPARGRSLQSVDQAVRTGSPFQINLRPYEEFGIEDSLFQVMVNSTRGGNDPALMNRILYYVEVGILEVNQDGGQPMTTDQILNYAAP